MPDRMESSSPERFPNYNLAAQNYLTGLNIPLEAKPGFIIITDQSLQLKGRQILANNLARVVRTSFPSATLDYLSYPDEAEADLVKKKLEKTIEDSKSPNLVAILLSGSFPWRYGVYDAVESRMDPGDKVIRFAYSPGLTAADILVLQQITPKIQRGITDAIDRRVNWFQQKQNGSIEILSGENKDCRLSLSFNMHNAPIIPSTGILSDTNQKGNIPSGEAHLVPYPFEESNGLIATTGGLIIQVKKGFIVSIVPPSTNTNITPQERELIKFMSSGNKIPLAELGLGVLSNLGIRSPQTLAGDDFVQSILTLEKLQEHCGFGIIAGKSTEDAEIKASTPTGFVHADVLLENAKLLHNGKESKFD